MEKLKVAIVGCGRISYKHVEALINNKEEIELVALCDIDIKKAELEKAKYIDGMRDSVEVNIYEDYKEMLEKEEIDVVAISTESGYHPEIAMYCMNKGKHVIVEKPMALSIKDADDMIECSRKNNVKLAVCHQNRFNEPIQKLRKAIEEDRFGKTCKWNCKNIMEQKYGIL